MRPLGPEDLMRVAVSMSRSSSSGEVVADGMVAVPRATIEITQIFAPRTCDTELARELIAATR